MWWAISQLREFGSPSVPFSQLCQIGIPFADTPLGNVERIGHLLARLAMFAQVDLPQPTEPTSCLVNEWAIQPYSPLSGRPQSPLNILSGWQARVLLGRAPHMLCGYLCSMSPARQGAALLNEVRLSVSQSCRDGIARMDSFPSK